jgi:cytosine/uracil/thiamine/allantoin permease
VIPPLRPLYDYAWFVGFIVSGLLHWALMKVMPPVGVPVQGRVAAGGR